jgi:hypothetical protein
MASVGQELLNVPFPEMVEALGMSIARAQHSLDMNSMRVAQMMSGSAWIEENDEGEEVVREGIKVLFGGKQLSLLELGFTPTFYQFVDTLIEVKLSISMKSETSESRSSTQMQSHASVRARVNPFSMSASASASLSVSTVSAAYAARNAYSAEGASLIRTKLVPLPPPAILQDRIRALLEQSKDSELEISPGMLELLLPSGAGGQTVTGAGRAADPAATITAATSSKPAVAEVTVSSDGKSVEVKAVAAGVTTISVSGRRAAAPAGGAGGGGSGGGGGNGATGTTLRGEFKVVVR